MIIIISETLDEKLITLDESNTGGAITDFFRTLFSDINYLNIKSS